MIAPQKWLSSYERSQPAIEFVFENVEELESWLLSGYFERAERPVEIQYDWLCT